MFGRVNPCGIPTGVKQGGLQRGRSILNCFAVTRSHSFGCRVDCGSRHTHTLWKGYPPPCGCVNQTRSPLESVLRRGLRPISDCHKHFALHIHCGRCKPAALTKEAHQPALTDDRRIFDRPGCHGSKQRPKTAKPRFFNVYEVQQNVSPFDARPALARSAQRSSQGFVE